MTRNLRVLLHCSIFALLPFMANAAGTYYNYNGMQQRNYNNMNTSGNHFYNYGSVYGKQAGAQNNTQQESRYQVQGSFNTGNNSANKNNVNNNFNADKQQKPRTDNYFRKTQTEGWTVDAGLSHQFAMWKFDMATAGSKLHYDNINWNVFDLDANYKFNMGSLALSVDAGLQYGKQFGETSMVDDDITNGGYYLQDWNVDLDGNQTVDQVWHQQGHALSIGTSNGGSMFGMYAGVGLTDFWRFGNFSITPSVGYRYFKYKLDTRQNYGLSLDTVSGADNYCQTSGGERQCLPFLVFVTDENSPLLGTIDAVDLDGDGYVDTISYVAIPSGAVYVESENTYFYFQDGVSHSYEVEWAGPYLALDMNYDMSMRDILNARVEIGLPSYTATADQPYRPDWQHPKSLEDTAGIGDAYHFGLGANWFHSLSDYVMLTVGMTFDYYHVNKASAASYLNPGYYTEYFYTPAVNTNDALASSEYYGSTNPADWVAISGRDLDSDKALYASNLDTIATIRTLMANDWKQKTDGEIESLYKSMGIRIGLQAKF